MSARLGPLHDPPLRWCRARAARAALLQVPRATTVSHLLLPVQCPSSRLPHCHRPAARSAHSSGPMQCNDPPRQGEMHRRCDR